MYRWPDQAPTANYRIQYARLMPRSDAGQRVLTWRIDAPGRRWRQTDCYGNVVDVISVAIGRTECEHLMTLVAARMASRNGATGIHATAAEALAREGGTCQDMTHVFLAACRAGGVPARYVSGYVLDGRSAAAPHAWAEAWIATAHRGAGAWLGFDVAHQRLSGPELCRLALGRDEMDAGPLRGSRMGGAGEELTVSVSVCAAA